MDFVSVSGGYWTGSSAVLALLKGNPKVYVPDNESSIFSYGELFKKIALIGNVDLSVKQIGEILNCINRLKVNSAKEVPILFSLIRFICYKFKITPSRFFNIRNGEGLIYGDDYVKAVQDLVNFLSYSLKINYVENILLELKVAKILLLSHSNKLIKTPDFILFDQLISPPYFNLVENTIPKLKMIFVDRDYKDQFAELILNTRRMLFVNNSLGIKPFDDVYPKNFSYENNFLDWFVQVRRKIEFFKKSYENSSKVLILNFEEVVQSPFVVLEKISNFLGSDSSEFKVTQYFNPEKSKKNIGVWKGIDKNILEILNHKLQI